MSVELLLYISGLALLDTLSPTIIGVTLYLLITDNRNLTTRLVAYLLTVAILYFSLGVTLMLGLEYIFDAFSTIFQNKTFSWIVFIIGVLMFVSSFLIPTNNKNKIPKPKSHSIFSMIGIGITTFIIEAGMALPYFTAIGLLTTNGLSITEWFPIIGVYNLIMIFPAIIIYIIYKIFKERINSLLFRLEAKITSNSNSALSWILCIVGVILIFNTLNYL